MTIVCNIDTVAASIAALHIPGVQMVGINNIPDTARGLTPIIIPQANNFVTGLNPSRETFGSGGTAKVNVLYTLNYVYLHAEAGSGLGAYAPYSSLIANLILIIETMIENDDISGAVDMELGTIGEISIINDPADNEYWGVFFSLSVLEYVQ